MPQRCRQEVLGLWQARNNLVLTISPPIPVRFNPGLPSAQKAKNVVNPPRGGIGNLKTLVAFPTLYPELPFHFEMFALSVLLLLGAAIGMRVEHIAEPGFTGTIEKCLVVFAVCVPTSLAFKQHRHRKVGDGLLTLYWAIAFSIGLHYCVAVAVRTSSPFSLQDEHLFAVDRMVGVDIPAFSKWAHTNWVGPFEDRMYEWLATLIEVTIFVPLLLGRARLTKLFVVANLVAFVIALPLCILLPAIGPWYAAHTVGNPGQIAAEAQVMIYRSDGVRAYTDAPWICFPSFHTIWPVLCACSLWQLKWLRWPVAFLAALIVLSTLTTGWHYLSDVAAGLIIASVSEVISRRVVAEEPPSASCP